jgi:hypothetical protein
MHLKPHCPPTARLESCRPPGESSFTVVQWCSKVVMWQSSTDVDVRVVGDLSSSVTWRPVVMLVLLDVQVDYLYVSIERKKKKKRCTWGLETHLEPLLSFIAHLDPSEPSGSC